MKELSVEEKAKRYDEAIERIENIKTGKCETTFMFTEGLFEHIFPELAESDDERIRKMLIKAFTTTAEKKEQEIYGNGITYKQVLAWLEKHGEQKPADKVEPKFHKGEWVCENEPNNYARFIQILEIVNVQGKDRYRISRDIHKDEDIVEFDFVEKYYHKFDIQDAKAGDVLAWDDSKCIVLFKNIYNKNSFNSHGFVGHCTGIFEPRQGYHNIEGAHPSTKEQRNLLFQKMKEAGYEWDAEKRELKKIEQSIEIPFGAKDSELQEASYHIPEGFHAEIDGNRVVIKKGEQKPAEWSEYDNEMFLHCCAAIRVADYSSIDDRNMMEKWFRNLKDRVQPQPKQEWSDEDEKVIDDAESWLDTLCDYLKDSSCEFIPMVKEVISKLKSLRPQSHWRPSKEMLEALGRAIPENVMEISEDEMLLSKLYQGLKYGRVLSKK